MTPTKPDDDQVLVDQKGRLGRIRLNRVKALNSLTLAMVLRIAQALDQFEADPEVVVVMISGEGDRGFCAGGDIRALYESGQQDGRDALAFWRAEYQLNARISHFKKPYVAIMDGLTMGGGIGLSAHGSFRVVTERTRLAMPEAAIGYFPDVGGTWLLARGPGEVGTYLGLTGEIVDGRDAIFAGLADVFVLSRDLTAVSSALETADYANPAQVRDLIAPFTQTYSPGFLETHSAAIDLLFAGDDVAQIFARLHGSDDPFAKAIEKSLHAKSPTSLKLALRLLRLGRASKSLEECLDREYAANHEILRRHDFFEGVRAAIIDKDKRPRWSPELLCDVSDEDIAAYLEPAMDPIFKQTFARETLR